MDRHVRHVSSTVKDAAGVTSVGAVLALSALASTSMPAQAQDTAPQTAVGIAQPWPMSLFSNAGAGAVQISPLLWGLLWLSVIVVVVITAFVLAGVWRGRLNPETQVERSGGGLPWIYIGVGVSTVVLVIFTGWTVSTMAALQNPPAKPALDISVTAHQWWWQVDYQSDDPSQTFETANEIHIPVGVPVAFKLRSADVIHSFWVPALGGKTDVIPGRTNVTWLQADKPGVYRGQCSEFCGVQHAHMAFLVIAQDPADFQRWKTQQLAPAAAPTEQASEAGEREFVLRCAACHTVRGTSAGGRVGPDLTHLMSRQTLAAGALKNNIADLSGWIADPQGIKPGSKMPNVELSGPELQSIRTYLSTLQ